MVFKTDCQEDMSTDVPGPGGARDNMAPTYQPAEANNR